MIKHTGSFNSLYKRFKSNSGLPFSPSTLRSHTPAHFKRGRRETDLCEYCENEAPLKRQMIQAETTKQALIESKQDTKGIDQAIHNLTESIDFIHHHKETAKEQRQFFHQQRDNLKADECIILFDFKENITVGNGPRETNRDFYNKSQRSVLGFTIFYQSTDKITTKTNQNKSITIKSIKHQFVHFISEVLAHDGLFVSDCLTKLHELSWIKKFKTVYYWSDCGPHFRSYEVLNHTIFEVPKLFNINTEHHFWGEKHGKSACDSEFSVLSQWLKELTTQKRIDSTRELLDSLRMHTADHEVNGGMTRTFIEYNRDRRPEQKQQAQFKSVQSYHCFSKSGPLSINCKVLSSHSNPVFESVSFKKTKDSRKSKHASDYVLPEPSKLVGPKTISAWKKGQGVADGKQT